MTSGGTRYLHLFANAAYVRVLFAGLGSTAGSSIAGVCLIWIVFSATGSALDVAFLGTAWIGSAILCSVFGGTLVDRYDRRKLMIGSDIARGGAMAFVAIDLAVRGFDLSGILAAYVVLGAFTTIFNPAEQAIIPSLLEPELVADANGLVRSSRSAVQFAGAAIAGAIILTAGGTVGIAANAATFAVSAALLTGMRVPRRVEEKAPLPSERGRYFSDVSEGFRWLWRSKGFFQLTLSATVFNFCSTIVGVFLVFFAVQVLHGSSLVYGLLLALEAAGSGIGSLLVGPLRAVRWAGPAWVVPYGVVSGAVAIALALLPSVPIAFLAVFALGCLGGFAGTAWLTAAQLLVPTEMQGRYYGIDQLGSIAVLPAAQIGGAFLIAGFGTQATYLIAGVAWAIAGVLFLLPRALWNLGYPPRSGAPVTPRTVGAEAGTPGWPEGSQGG